ncbi:MAG: DNA-binding protein [Desulfurococcales archaeon ex4484_204]|nr:MAG: DNA-binding protein [Desulfurococcales archaeon ex4484_204]
MPARRGKVKPFKACTKCKHLVPHEVGKCPVCGSESFTDDWAGMVIIVDVERSDIAKMLGLKHPGRYAIRLGS